MHSIGGWLHLRNLHFFQIFQIQIPYFKYHKVSLYQHLLLQLNFNLFHILTGFATLTNIHYLSFEGENGFWGSPATFLKSGVFQNESLRPFYVRGRWSLKQHDILARFQVCVICVSSVEAWNVIMRYLFSFWHSHSLNFFFWSQNLLLLYKMKGTTCWYVGTKVKQAKER